ncbi:MULTISPECIES: hypothetical protein [unclassified Mesorhizobium]|uniref:hypothetical protein n=1 Tax=unclassified Mesorhizobium TaxID=325217 RepID=UPI000FCBC225|nr:MULTISPECIES: hypothetical protein [unclassified Mesorhizobium]TIT77347.1 MAG: hypothetical protein E5W56_13780 [Mesorhizobium sp.]TGP22003.1 hypothetical protein EN874_021250 [Mesorhizobium sp. M1D.F.Ca.ET.231.01.1.1]TGP30388.1 hypothetical protein EN877_19630 [Mesorhizobium sp. M1D.F.Ca.ET.234.01.1.1]TGS44464.1 hypothetical protein EN827_19625 [Mesorhizobium sp. M1D.F.Ca.ET.184.01.1.1]TGS60504.1 hypothetical protein EN826_019625 [Mesorhizobium sp. M1D.F.Ca.ET.183.01.1.1]
MKNVTLAVDEGLLEKARGLAGRRKTTLNALIRALLEHEVEQEDRIAWAKAGMKRLMDEAAKRSDSADTPYKWDRRDAYADREDRLLSRHERPDLRGFGEKS